MHIINAMFGRGLGGIEQAFIDYCEALKLQGDKVTAIIHPKAKIRPALVKVNVNIIEVKNLGAWDIFAKSYLRKILKQLNPDAAIAHGNRAFNLLKSPCRTTKCPLVGVTHNYNIKHLIGADAIFAITEDLRKTVIKAGQIEATIFKIPNMIRLLPQQPEIKQFNSTPTIGTMGRFIKKKGFDVFLHAIAHLKNRNIKIKAVIGGSGEEESALKELAKNLEIEDIIEFKGWIQNKEELFDNIDIFCLTSLSEPFGIILLEALAFGKPIITSDAEGPSEIATNNKDALIIAKNDSMALSLAIEQLIKNPAEAKNLAVNGLETVKNYNIENIGKKMHEALEKISAGKN